MYKRCLAAAACLFCVFGCEREAAAPADFRALASHGKTNELLRAVQAGADFNRADERGFTPLAVAAFNGHAETVKALLDLGANPEQGPSDVRPLYLAASQAHEEVVRLLLAQGAHAEQPGGDFQPLAAASSPKVIDMLIRAGANVNTRSGEQAETPLHRAISQSNYEAVKTLLAHKPSLELTNLVGATPVHVACRPLQSDLRAGSIEDARKVLRLLLRANPNLNAKDGRGFTPLHYAARHPHWTAEDLQLLISAGAKVDVPDMSGRTALDIAKAAGTDKDPRRTAVLSGKA